MHFDLIDQVLEQDDRSITAIKAVTLAEEYLQDHFPRFPVLPGVMMLETMVQAARKLAAAQPTPPQGPLMIRQVRNLRYGNMVRPGQHLKVTVTLREQTDQTFAFEGKGMVGDDVAVHGRFTLEPAEGMEERH